MAIMKYDPSELGHDPWVRGIFGLCWTEMKLLWSEGTEAIRGELYFRFSLQELKPKMNDRSFLGQPHILYIVWGDGYRGPR